MNAIAHPLVAADLVPGRKYWSPSGLPCMLRSPGAKGLSCNTLLFSYLNRDGRPYAEEGFALDKANATAIAAMREMGE